MLNRYPLWKNLMVILVVAIDCFIPLPNIYGEDPAVQISGTADNKTEAGARKRRLTQNPGQGHGSVNP